jgi:hypothetical protein
MSSSPSTPRKPDGGRIARTISFTPDQDQYLIETVGESGNVSEFVRAVVDAARTGRVSISAIQAAENPALERARAYHRAKESGMSFEEDVGRVLDAVFKKDRTVRVVRSRVHNGEGVFVADFSVEDPKGGVLLSLQCKSSPRPDRLNLALAEAMIGSQKTKAPVVTVIPYNLPESREAESQFAQLSYTIVTLEELAEKIGALVAKRKG